MQKVPEPRGGLTAAAVGWRLPACVLAGGCRGAGDASSAYGAALRF